MSTRILIVEDEPAIAENVRYALATEGYEVRVCATGGAATAALAEQPYALIVLDVGLPDVSGFEWCRQLRRSSDVPIIFLTARAEEIDRIVGLEIGADDYVTKPFSPRELAARVKVILRRASGNGDVQATTTDASVPAAFQIDAARCRIVFHGQPLDLSRYEFCILEALLRRPGRVFTRAQLLAQVSSDPTPSLERTVDSHIKALRAKLRRVAPDDDPIQTHRGFGYSLKEPA